MGDCWANCSPTLIIAHAGAWTGDLCGSPSPHVNTNTRTSFRDDFYPTHATMADQLSSPYSRSSPMRQGGHRAMSTMSVTDPRQQNLVSSRLAPSAVSPAPRSPFLAQLQAIAWCDCSLAPTSLPTEARLGPRPWLLRRGPHAHPFNRHHPDPAREQPPHASLPEGSHPALSSVCFSTQVSPLTCPSQTSADALFTRRLT